MLRLLYVEDQTEDCELFIRLLHLASDARQIPAEAVCVRSLDEVGEAPMFDALLIDLELGNGPRHTVGWIALRAQRFPAIVIVSGASGMEADCLKAGAQDYWHKPDVISAPQIFIDAVNKAVIRHRLR